MDDLDHRLIGLLREDARTPLSDLADRLKVSRGTVQNRLDKLQRDGILLGFTVRLRTERADGQVHAITSVEIEGGAAVAVIKALRGVPAVNAVHSTNGRWDLVAELAAADLAGFSNALDQIRAIPGIVASETSILLKTVRF